MDVGDSLNEGEVKEIVFLLKDYLQGKFKDDIKSLLCQAKENNENNKKNNWSPYTLKKYHYT